MKPLVFDRPASLELNAARMEFLDRWVPAIGRLRRLETALDAGCGVGYFSAHLCRLGLRVTGVDGRAENVEEARRRQPGIPFLRHDVEDAEVRALGTFDLVLCFGLLYHLENPLAAVRNLRALTAGVLVVESMVLPSARPLAALVDESRAEDQGLNYVAFVPSPSCLVKMLSAAGFAHVYRPRELPRHPDFRPALDTHRRREVLLAAAEPLALLGLEAVAPREVRDVWSRSRWRAPLARVAGWLRKPPPERRKAVGRRLRRLAHACGLPFPMRLPGGARWLAADDQLGDLLAAGEFEPAETRFVQRFLRAGMVVVDVGAHDGFYTVVAAREVGPGGRVIAFEPSPRERARLRRNVRWNRLRNVRVEPAALAARAGRRSLHVVAGRRTGLNSLRPPATEDPTSTLEVSAVTLDAYLAEHGVARVDLLKLDAEGAELEVLEGSRELLRRRPRPVILAEVDDVRTAAWGYRGADLVARVEAEGYRCFALAADGTAVAREAGAGYNLAFVPAEAEEARPDLFAPEG